MRPDTEADGAWKELEAGGDASGMRLDQWLAAQLAPDTSRSRVRQLIEAGAVTVNGAACTMPKRKVSAGDRIAVALPEPEDAVPLPEAIPLDILHEDEHLIVIDKPAGLVVHPGAGNPSGTLVNALLHHCGDSLAGIGGVKRPGLVHRLDKDTSGVMVVAKTEAAHRHLSAQFADHGRTGALERAYVALVWGVPERRSGTIDAPLGRDATHRTRQAVVRADRADARDAVTHYEVLESFAPAPGAAADASLVRCILETGRTHQIRVHMAHSGHPLIGDPEYGGGFRTKANRLAEPLRGAVERFPRQALHAAHLAFEHPATGELMSFDSPLPDDLSVLVEAFRQRD